MPDVLHDFLASLPAADRERVRAVAERHVPALEEAGCRARATLAELHLQLRTTDQEG